jgi:excisionase family DNA binding protein
VVVQLSHVSRISQIIATLGFMKSAQKSMSPAKAPARQAIAAVAMGAPGKTQPIPALKVTVEVDPLMDVVRRHARVSPRVAKLIEEDFMRLFGNPTFGTALTPDKAKPTAGIDPVLSTQEAADLLGVSRPYIVTRVEAGEIPLHQQVGNQRRVLRSEVLAWHRREQARRRRTLGQLGADLDSEIFAG